MRAVLVLAVFLSACAMQTTPIIPVVNCPQPTADALAPATGLSTIPELSTDPMVTIGVLGDVIAMDTKAYADEAAKRQALIDFGAKQCGWVK